MSLSSTNSEYEIVSNESPNDASKYLNDLLEKTYRERLDSEGDLIEITDDDVSVAVMVYNQLHNNGEEENIETKTNESETFKEMFFVVIQLGAILAVVVLYFKKLMPFSKK